MPNDAIVSWPALSFTHLPLSSAVKVDCQHAVCDRGDLRSAPLSLRGREGGADDGRGAGAGLFLPRHRVRGARCLAVRGLCVVPCSLGPAFELRSPLPCSLHFCSADRLVLYHYATKSASQFEAKMLKGMRRAMQRKRWAMSVPWVPEFTAFLLLTTQGLPWGIARASTF